MIRVILFLSMGVGFLYGFDNDGNIGTIIQWWSIIALGIVSLMILLFSSYQMKKIKKLHEDIDKKQHEMEINQNELLTNMSENIYDIAKDAIKNRSRVLDEPDERSLENVLAKVINAENALLDMTNDLIGFLRLKSKKVEINKDKFNINNVLNEVSGSVSMHFTQSDTELIFDIDNTIPRYLEGDSLHLGQILTNLLENAMLNTEDGEIRLEANIFDTPDGNNELEFKIIDTGNGMSKDNIDNLYNPYYNDETKEYVGLSLYVTKELVELMSGSISVSSVEGKGTTFTVVLPIVVIDNSNNIDYMLSEKTSISKKVLISDTNYNSALAIRNMFNYFNYDVNIISANDFNKNALHLTEYDMIFLGDKLFSSEIVSYLEKTVEYLDGIGKENGLKIVALESIFSQHRNKLIDEISDRVLTKPLNQERLFELITDLYQHEIPRNLPTLVEEKKSILFTHQDALEEAENIKREHFADFEGSKILLVEDNLINQKVLINILDKSGIEIIVANNGLEALDLIIEDKIDFDLVLMDINMPVMDGYTATEKLREMPIFDELPIVAFSALVLDSEIKKMYDCGMNAFLSKPINMGKMYSAFELFLDINMSGRRELLPEEEDISEIDGLNIEEGINYSNGNPAIYMEVLSEFLEAYGDSGEAFEKLVKENRNEQIKMLSLDMKGLTGAIGAKDMFFQVNEIHKLFIYNNQHLLHKYIDSYKKELERLKKAIHKYLDSQ
ncbi:Sensory box histidine kinase/response regulator [hydrothermal vent metagenome]|uniref:Sensory box histidine kinase/response regulator n=1 Tax=hydrothermal vent metagenome TaxID=652676 RepID=A0A1W1C6W2_9ZZZZ